MISEHNSQTFKYDIIHNFKVSLWGDNHLWKCAWQSAAEGLLGSINLSKSKVGCCDLVSSSTRTGQSLSSVASRRAMCDVVSWSNKEGLGGIIFWLDAVVSRAVLLEVEQAACKKSQLSWAVCMQEDHFQPISYIIIAAGLPAVLYHSWSSSWRVKQENRIARKEVHTILLTKECMQFCLSRNLKHTNNQLLDHFHNGWMLVGYNGRSIINSGKIYLKLPASQAHWSGLE